MRSFLVATALAGSLLAGSLLAGDFQCEFTAGAWQAKDWVMVKSPRWPHRGEWEQEKDCLRNRTPKEATQKEMLGKRAGETYTSMLLKEPVSGNLKMAATMSFEHRMAPLIVLAPALDKDAQGYPEYREHWEIVLFDQGVNVWHHTYADGKPGWRKAAYAKFPLKAGQRYRLEVDIKRAGAGAQLTLRVGDHEFGYFEPVLPKTFQVGITGCEGVNRFYDFTVRPRK
ncbi:MAG: hypothetical protein HN904_17065 [Victivallales bacterium]|nr:hypothetical protein [Victivallales bacterium]